MVAVSYRCTRSKVRRLLDLRHSALIDPSIGATSAVLLIFVIASKLPVLRDQAAGLRTRQTRQTWDQVERVSTTPGRLTVGTLITSVR